MPREDLITGLPLTTAPRLSRLSAASVAVIKGDETIMMKAYGFADLEKTREDLVRVFGNKPFDFKPGEEQLYNNSGFFLAGLLIERLTGMTYAEFVQENLFDHVGMKDSYCSEEAIRKNHAHGYDTDPSGRLIHKAYVDHTWPYSAGSLCSTVEDMSTWVRALHGGKVLTPASYREMTSPGTLNDGTKIRYGLGIGVAELGGRRAIGHGGGANGFGFLSESEYFPDDDLYIVVLLNTAGPIKPWDMVGQIADVVLGRAPDRARPFPGEPVQFAGTYAGGSQANTLIVTVSGGELFVTGVDGAGAPAEPLKFYGNDIFGVKGTLLIFEREDGRVSRLRLDKFGVHAVLARQ